MNIKLAFLATMAAVSILGCSRQDPIDRVIGKVEHESVPSYLFVPIALPATATPDQCVAALSKRVNLGSHRILEVRQTNILFSHYTAVLLDTGIEKKVVLLEPMGTNGWYYRVYDTK